VARSAGTYFYYPFAFLVLEQQFLCAVYPGSSDATSATSYAECSAAEICHLQDTDPSYNDFKVDTNYKYYLDNWFIEMDLKCMTTAAIGFMVTAYYIGFAIGGLFFGFPDKYGRKKSLILGLAISCIAQTVVITSSNYWVRFAMFGLSGLSQIKNSVSYVWLSECTSQPFKSQAFTFINIFDAMPMAITCLYFMFVSKHWVYLSLFFCVLSYLALAAAFFCPESPRWLLIKGNS